MNSVDFGTELGAEFDAEIVGFGIGARGPERLRNLLDIIIF